MLNLGDITFGLEVDTKGLRKAVASLEQFQKQVDQVTRSQEQGSQRAVRAYAAQERVIRRAIASTAQQIAELRRFGAAPEHIARATNSLRALQNQMQRGTLNAVEFNRAQDRFNLSMQKTKRTLDQLKFNAINKQGARFNEVLRDLESASVLAVGPLSGLGARVRALGAITSRSTLAIAGFLGGITAAIIAVAKLTTSSLRARRTLNEMESGFVAATGSIFATREEMQFAIDVSRRLGLNLSTVGSEYSKLAAATKGTALEGEQTRKIFLGVSTAATALQFNAEKTAGVFRALQQIISKGRVQAEELRGQFGERIPGGFRLAADAIGKTTAELDKMLESGQLTAEDLLPKLADALVNKFGTAAERAAQKMAALEQGLSTAFLQFADAVDHAIGVSSAYEEALRDITAVLDFLRVNLDTVISSLVATTAGFVGFFAATSRGIAIIRALGSGIRTVASGLIGLRAASFAAIGGFTPLLAAAAAFGAAFIAMKYILDDTQEQEAQFNEVMAEAKDIIDQTTKSVEELAKARVNAAAAALEAQIIALNEQFANAADEVDRLNEELDRLTSFGESSEDQLNVSTAVANLKTASDTAQELQDKINNASESLDKLREISDRPTGEGIKDLSASTKKAADDIRELARAYMDLQQQQSLLAEGGDQSALDKLKALQEAREQLFDVPSGERTAILKVLRDLGIEADTAAEALALLIYKTNELEDAVGRAEDRLTDVPEALGNAANEMARLREEIQATLEGPKALEAFNDAISHSDAVQKFTETLEKAGVAQAEINKLTSEYSALLEELDRAQDVYDQAEKALRRAEATASRMVDHLGDAITRMFVEGADAAIDWGNVVMRILGEVFQLMLDIALLNPLRDLFAGALTGVAGGIAGGGGGGTLYNPNYVNQYGYGKGGAFFGGVKKAARGMVLNGPTMFAGAGAAPVIGGEAGAEALVPLETVGGKLGVNVAGAHPITVNVYNNTDSEVSVSRSEGPGGGINVDILIDRMVSKAIRSGGESFTTLTQLFGARPTVAQR